MYYPKAKICCICGKSFYPAVMHMYKRAWKRKTYYACKPSCYEKMLKAIEREKKGMVPDGTVNKLLDKDGPDVL